MNAVTLQHIQSKYPQSTEVSYVDRYETVDSGSAITLTGLYPENVTKFDFSDNKIKNKTETGETLFPYYNTLVDYNLSEIVRIEVPFIDYKTFQAPVVNNFVVELTFNGKRLGLYAPDPVYFEYGVASTDSNPYYLHNLLSNGIVKFNLDDVMPVVHQMYTTFRSYKISRESYNFITRVPFEVNPPIPSVTEKYITYSEESPSRSTATLYKIDVVKLMQWISWICTSPYLDEIEYNNVIPINILAPKLL